MKGPVNNNYADEFKELTGDLSDTIQQMVDPVAIGQMLYAIAEEKKSNNLVVRDINGKFENMMAKLDRIATLLETLNQNIGAGNNARPAQQDIIDVSDRDQEILDFVAARKRACADDVQDHFQYKGRNAASARLNKLFREGRLEKIFAGRSVYYTIK